MKPSSTFAVLLRDAAGLSDGQLLEDYLFRREEAALAALVKRHGPMVWAVCRRVLRDHHDAEDAFQATFLVLVRKAASIVPRKMLVNWLYGVARQTALKARATTSKRKGRERQVAEMPEPAVMEQALYRDLQPVLDDELSRLPDKYRTVIVLCDLEGRTRKEAARQLSVPEGTVAGWLARARTMLAKRLARRGPAVSGAALAVMLAQNVASASVPTSVVSTTIKAATLFAAGQATAAGAISPSVAALTEGVLKAMLLNKLKVISGTAILLIGLLGGSALHVAQGAPQAPFEQKNLQVVKGAEEIFPGDWINVDENTGGLTRIAITKTDDGWSIQAWGQAGKREIDQGKTTLQLLRDYEAKGNTDEEKTMKKYGFATWDHKFKDAYLTLRIANERIVGEEYNLFKDKSDRPNSRFHYEFKKKD